MQHGAGEHVQATRLLRLYDNGAIELSEDAAACLNSLYALQSPSASPWGRPMLRLMSQHEASGGADVSLRVSMLVYASASLFELISDDSIRVMMSHLKAVSRVSGPAVLRPAPATPMFDCSHRDGSDEMSLAGLLKHAESSGYEVRDAPPPALRTDLLLYQRSACQWMLDHERDPHALNHYFWQRRDWLDGGDPLWYFPLGGEFRMQTPPHTTGGLLAQEMGLGKSVRRPHTHTRTQEVERIVV